MQGKLKNTPFYVGRENPIHLLHRGQQVTIIDIEEHPIYGKRYKIPDCPHWLEANCFESVGEGIAEAEKKRVYISIGNGKYEAYKIVSQPYVSKVVVERLSDGEQGERKLTELLTAREVRELAKKRLEDMHNAYEYQRREKERGMMSRWQ